MTYEILRKTPTVRRTPQGCVVTTHKVLDMGTLARVEHVTLECPLEILERGHDWPSGEYQRP